MTDSTVTLRRPLRIRGAECGVADARFEEQEDKSGTVTVCYELVKDITDRVMLLSLDRAVARRVGTVVPRAEPEPTDQEMNEPPNQGEEVDTAPRVQSSWPKSLDEQFRERERMERLPRPDTVPERIPPDVRTQLPPLSSLPEGRALYQPVALQSPAQELTDRLDSDAAVTAVVVHQLAHALTTLLPLRVDNVSESQTHAFGQWLSLKVLGVSPENYALGVQTMAVVSGPEFRKPMTYRHLPSERTQREVACRLYGRDASSLSAVQSFGVSEDEREQCTDLWNSDDQRYTKLMKWHLRKMPKRPKTSNSAV